MRPSSPTPRPSRRWLGRCALLAVVGALAACEAPVPRDQVAARLESLEQPHLVLIVVDTLRADRTSPYGFEESTTPELQRWAERGVVFEHARSESSWTKISMASMLTSLWPRSHAIREARDGLGEAAVTLAEVLQDGGYATYAVQTNGWLDQSFGFQQGFDRYVFPVGGGVRGLPRATIWPHAERVYEEAERLIDAHDPGRPMFLYLHFMDVHEYAAPNEYKRFGTDSEGAYLGAIRWVDATLERLRERLDDAGLLDRTVMVFGSDHGEAFGENGRYGHARNVLTATAWTPLVIRLPFSIEPVRVDTQVRNVDIGPTLLHLAQLQPPASFEGRSLVPLATGAVAEEDRESYAGLGLPLYPDASVQIAVTDGAWLYARNVEPDPNPAVFLFDRRVDPGENVNLIELEPEQATRMKGRMDGYLAGESAPGVKVTDVRIDPSIAERLRAMGYLD